MPTDNKNTMYNNNNNNKKATASALKSARWDHLNGSLQTSLEEKNTKPFHRYIKAQKTIILVFPL